MVILGGVSKDLCQGALSIKRTHADPPDSLADGVQVKLHGCFAYRANNNSFCSIPLWANSSINIAVFESHIFWYSLPLSFLSHILVKRPCCPTRASSWNHTSTVLSGCCF